MPFQKGDPKPTNSGRKKGSTNKRTLEIEQAIAAEGMTPLAFMLAVLRDPHSSDKDRQWAADAAAPYVHARRSSVESRNLNIAVDRDSDLNLMTQTELDAEADRLVRSMGYVPIDDGKPPRPPDITLLRSSRQR